MAFNERSLDDYVDVAERIAAFYRKYPEGSLQPYDPGLSPYQIVQVQGSERGGQEVQQTFIVYVAAAYRDRDDTRPGIGIAWEVFPGRTNFTRGSEVMNAETSAWGRAIAALGIATKKGVASRQEIANRRHEREDGLPVNADGSLSRSRTTDEQKNGAGVMTDAQLAEHTALGGGHPKERRTPRAERAKVTRTRPAQPAADIWAPIEHENRPGSADQGQIAAIMAAYTKLGFDTRTDREQLLNNTEKLIGRSLKGPDGKRTHNNLTWNEAADLKKTLKDCNGDRGLLMERLTGIRQAAAAVSEQDAAEGTQEEAPVPP